LLGLVTNRMNNIKHVAFGNFVYASEQ